MTIDGEHCKIHMHEIANPDKVPDQLVNGTEGIVYFYNTASRSSYNQIKAIYNKIQNLSPFQIVLVGIVLAGTEQEVSQKQVGELAQELKCGFSVETEATAENVLSKVIRLCRQVQGDDMGVSWGWWSCFG